MIATTDLGSLWAVAGMAVGLASAGKKRTAVNVAVAGLAAWQVAQSSKGISNRLRPYQQGVRERLIPEPMGSSMPSGHTAVTTAVAVVTAGRARPGRRWPWVALPIWVAATRVGVGVHYPSDTVVGAGIGAVVGFIVDRAVPAVYEKFNGSDLPTNE